MPHWTLFWPYRVLIAGPKWPQRVLISSKICLLESSLALDHPVGLCFMENGSNSLEYMINAPLDTILALKGPHGGPPMASKGPHLAINIPFCANGGPKLFLCGPNSVKWVS